MSPHAIVQVMILGVLTHSSPAFQAQDEAAPSVTEHAGASLEFRLTPGVYLPRLVGTSSLGPAPGAGHPDFRADFDLNQQERLPNVELSIIRNDTWQLLFNGFEFDTNKRGRSGSSITFGDLTINPGDVIDAEFSLSSFGIELGYRQWRPYDDPGNVELFLMPSFGIRLYEIGQSVERPGVGRAEVKEAYLNAYVGIQFDMRWHARETIRWLERFEANAGIYAGPALGADSGIGWSIRAGMNFFFTENVSVLFGYRLYELSIEDGDYELIGGLQGLFLGGTIRF